MIALTTSTKDTVDFAIRVFQALLTPFIGITTLYIAKQQYRLAEDKQRLELYERRSTIYRVIMRFLSEVAQTGDTPQEKLITLLRETSEAKFLFGAEIDDFVKKMYARGVALQSLNHEIENLEGRSDDPFLKVFAEKRGAEFTWFNDQFEVSQKLFKHYLAVPGS